MIKTDKEPFYKYCRGLMVEKLSEARGKNNPKELEKLHRQVDQIEKAIVSMEYDQEENNKLRLDNHNLKLEIRDLNKELSAFR